VNIENDKYYYRGVLKIDDPVLPDRYLPTVVHALKEYSPALFEGVDTDRNCFEKLLYDLKKETIDHNMFFRKSGPKQNDLNYHLVKGIWKFVQSWCQDSLKFTVREVCPISIVERNEMGRDDAIGLFRYERHNRRCEIRILESILDNTQYFLITLVHEYMHYVHYSFVSFDDYHNCPKVFSEGFSEYYSRIFYEQSGYDIQEDFRKSWNTSYEIGRKIVRQICSEGFGIYGFANGFLRNIPNNNPWKSLDHLFR
jgi:hypothetical protein